MVSPDNNQRERIGARFADRNRHSTFRLELTPPARLLTAEEEILLVRRAARGDVSARNCLIECNRGLVVSLARRYAPSCIEIADLIQEGILGLMHAVKKFDPAKGCRLSTYATWWIRRAITRAIIRQGRTICIPVHIAEEIHRTTLEAERLRHILNREPTVDEVASALDTVPQRIGEIQTLLLEPMSLDMPVSERRDNASLGEQVQGGRDSFTSEPSTQVVQRDEVARMLSCLDERQRTVLQMHFGLNGRDPRTLEEIGAKLHITSDNARQIERRAIRKLQRVFPMHTVSEQG